jgi:ATP-dependent Clp protease, protease subunit
MKKIFCGIPVFAQERPKTPRQYFSVQNEASADRAEIKLYDVIGEDWLGEGDGAKSFSDALSKIPKGRKILVRINSPGGNVWDGIAMYKLLRERKDDVTTQIDGIALSIASVIALGGSKVVISRTGQFMAHNPWTGLYVEGDEQDIAEAARLTIDSLAAAKKSIQIAYMDKTGKPEPDVSEMMNKTTWLVGDEAKTAGFVDEVCDEEAVSNSFDLSSFKRVPEAFRKLQNSAAQGGGQSSSNTMDKATIIALLKEHGVEVDANSTIEQLQAKLKECLAKAKAQTATPPAAAAVPAPSAPSDDVTNRLKSIEAKYEAERKTRIIASVDALIQDRRVLATERDFLVESAMADERHLENASARPQQPLPHEGLHVECVSESIHDICKHAKNLTRQIVNSADFCVVGDKAAADRIRAAMQNRSGFIRKNLAKIGQIWNTNTVDSTLKQDVIVDVVLMEFSRVLLPLARFSTLFSNVSLRGNDIVQVPFLAIRTDGSANDFSAGTGYNTVANTTNDNRPITINKRKYLHIGHSSSELARQPFLYVQEQLKLLGQQLAYLVWLDVMSVVVAANYGVATAPGGSTAGSWPKAAGAMDSNSIADLQLIADTARFPIGGRVLFVNGIYDNALKKDNAFKLQLNFGGTEVMRDGRIPNVYGFDYYNNVFLPGNSENLAGIIANKQAIIMATAPIPPTEEVRRAGTVYSLAVDADTGIPLEYRSFGSNVLDTTQQGFECNYGYGPGDGNALFRLTTQ